jgi:hypothetical protein
LYADNCAGGKYTAIPLFYCEIALTYKNVVPYTSPIQKKVFINDSERHMAKNAVLKIRQVKKKGRFYLLAASLLICMALSGCTVNRVSLLTRQPTGSPVKEISVKFFPNFKEMNEPWRLEGMISAYTLPIVNNTQKKREALIKETAAGMGINAVVGLLPDVGSGVKRTGRTTGLLANVGTKLRDNEEAMPKFIVCLPPVNFKIERNPSMAKLDDYLREYIQFFFSYMKGYYVYKYDAPDLNNDNILQGSIDSAILNEPLGITPDFALLCDVDGYDEKGNIALQRSYTLKLKMTLFDLKEKKPVWTSRTEGISTKSLLGAFVMGGLVAGPLGSTLFVAGEVASDDDLHTARFALMNAMDSLPAVKGFRGGAISSMDRN